MVHPRNTGTVVGLTCLSRSRNILLPSTSLRLGTLQQGSSVYATSSSVIQPRCGFSTRIGYMVFSVGAAPPEKQASQSLERTWSALPTLSTERIREDGGHRYALSSSTPVEVLGRFAAFTCLGVLSPPALLQRNMLPRTLQPGRMMPPFR